MNQVTEAVLAPGPRPWSRVMPWVAWALLPVLGVLFTLQVQARSDRRDEQLRRELYRDLCAAVVPLDDEFKRTPPTSPIGKELAVAYARMRVTLECDPPR